MIFITDWGCSRMTRAETQSREIGAEAPGAGRRYLPLGVDVSNLPCLVVGGGRVGSRKALTLAEAGARVTVLAPEISESLREALESGDIAWERAVYHAESLEGQRLVVAATDDSALNIRIGGEADAQGILACVVSSGRSSRVIFPAVHRRGDLTVAVHSDGRDPVAARRTRDSLALLLAAEPGNGAALDRGNIRVGGRGSALSVAQMNEALVSLRALLPGTPFEVKTLETPGDRDKHTPLPTVREEDFFTRDLDDALLSGDIDLAVHSAKDLPVPLPDGLCVAALLPATIPWECLVAREADSLSTLPAGARVGTSSERRRERLGALRPDLEPREIRGDIPDRLAQLDDGKFDALILAAVGLVRLGLTDRITQVFTPREFPPMPGQGALALMVREADTALRHALAPLDLGDREGLPWA